jgi:tRNA(Arg) A34 adenosine deaminase TadA
VFVTSSKPEIKQSLADLFPEIASQAHGWNPTDVKAQSHFKRRWKCGQGHEWDATIKGRTSGKGCPICSGKYVLAGFNDLSHTHPEIALQAVGWDPKTVTAGSNQKVRWRCALAHEWDAAVADRTRKDSTHCPFCMGKRVWKGFNDLVTTHPEIALQAVGWDPTEVSAGSSRRKLRWRCNLAHEWDAVVKSRVRGHGCPICSGKYVLAGFNDLSHTHPAIALQAVGWDPTEVSAGSDQKRRWHCENNHEWDAAISSRTQGYGCPICSKSGFDPFKPAWLYFLDHDDWNMFKIGITNVPDDRLARHKGNGWTVLEVRGPMIGASARSLEVTILSALSRRGAAWAKQSNGSNFDGYTESWTKESFYVTSIKQMLDWVYEDEAK